MHNYTEYGDLIAFHPGSYVEEMLGELGETPESFAGQVGVPASRLQALVQGACAMDAELAAGLWQATGISAKTWLSIQTTYERDLAKIQKQMQLEQVPAREWFYVLNEEGQGTIVFE